MPSSKCAGYFLHRQVTESQYCAYDPTFLGDACEGDSGGPLQIFKHRSSPAYVLGVVSYGKGTCPSNAPDIYTKVGYYLDWIQSHVWPNETPMKYFEDKNVNSIDSGMHSIALLTTKGNIRKIFVDITYGANL